MPLPPFQAHTTPGPGEYAPSAKRDGGQVHKHWGPWQLLDESPLHPELHAAVAFKAQSREQYKKKLTTWAEVCT